MSTQVVYDEKTLKTLITEATKKFKAAYKEWRKYDSSEAMHEMEGWQQTIEWLKRLSSSGTDRARKGS